MTPEERLVKTYRHLAAIAALWEADTQGRHVMVHGVRETLFPSPRPGAEVGINDHFQGIVLRSRACSDSDVGPGAVTLFGAHEEVVDDCADCEAVMVQHGAPDAVVDYATRAGLKQASADEPMLCTECRQKPEHVDRLGDALAAELAAHGEGE